MLGVGLGALVVAWAFGWEEFAIVAAACLVSLVIGVVFLFIGDSSLGVLLALTTPRVVAGDPASTSVEATNEASRRMLPVRLETRVGKGVAHVNVPALAAGASHDELFVIPTSRRSIVPVGPVRSVQGDPLGLVRRERTWTGTETLYVHPKTVRVSSLTTGWMRDLEGETTNDRSPSDVAFHTLREYVVGDDRRHIHWRTTARQVDGKLMVREFVDTRRAHLGLLLSVDDEDYRNEDEFELAVSALGSMGLRGLADEQEVTCVAGARRVPSYHGSSFLDSLAGLELGSDDTSLVSSAARGRDVLRSVSVAVVVTGSAGDGSAARAAVDRLGSSVHTIIIRAGADGESVVRASSGAPVIELVMLEDLPRLVFAVTAP
ncbi:MAG: DUF58 domain-containing protein [Acidimicrobiales bacterium]|nr:DUF58 domain-containing protein [Acidimicrobiales bacterium]